MRYTLYAFTDNPNRCGELRGSCSGNRSQRKTPATKGQTCMDAILDQLRICPQCHDTLPLSAFKLRSRLQGRAPSWCRECRNRKDRERRVRHHSRVQKLALNECLRRIRRNSPPDRASVLFSAAFYLAGGSRSFAEILADRVRSKSPVTALRAIALLIVLVRSCDTGTEKCR